MLTITEQKNLKKKAEENLEGDSDTSIKAESENGLEKEPNDEKDKKEEDGADKDAATEREVEELRSQAGEDLPVRLDLPVLLYGGKN